MNSTGLVGSQANDATGAASATAAAKVVNVRAEYFDAMGASSSNRKRRPAAVRPNSRTGRLARKLSDSLQTAFRQLWESILSRLCRMEPCEAFVQCGMAPRPGAEVREQLNAAESRGPNARRLASDSANPP